MKAKGNNLYEIIDPQTGDWITFNRTTTGYDGTTITGANEATYIDNVIYVKLSAVNGGGYAKRVVKNANVDVRWFGAVADGAELNDVSMTSGSAVVTSASGKFKPSDLYKVMCVRGAGSTEGNLKKTIISYQSPTQVTLSGAATASVSNAKTWYGTDVFSQLRKAFLLGRQGYTIYVPKGENGAFYYAGANIPCYGPVEGDGDIRSVSTSLFTGHANNIYLKNLNLELFPATTNSAPHIMSCTNYNNLSFERCSMKNGRVSHINNTLSRRTGFSMKGCTMSVNFSDVEHIVEQNDAVTVMGIDGVVVEGNDFDINYVHRGFKFTESSANTTSTISAYNTRNIIFEKNKVKAITDSGKQLIDCYKGCENLLLSGNNIEISGFNTCIENKTGEEQSFKLNFKIVHNTIKTDNEAISMQGTVGSSVITNGEAGHQNILVFDNDIETSYVGIERFPVTIRFYHDVQVIGNRFTHASKNPEVIQVEVLSSKRSLVMANTLFDGCLRVRKVITNHNGVSYAEKFESCTISENTLHNANGGTLEYAPISVNGINAPNGQVTISNNPVNIVAPISGTAKAQSYISLVDATLGNVILSGNNGRGYQAIAENVKNITSTITKTTVGLNSWDELRKAAAQSDSTATDVAGIVADYNALLAKLRTAELLTT